MRRLWAAWRLIWCFLRDVVSGGWATALAIVSPRRPLPGLVRLPYGDLPDSAAALLGALISLTPGTTTVDIDGQRREFLLHLLDLEQADAVLASIRRDFVGPVAVLFGRTA